MLIRLNPSSGVPIYLQIVEQIRHSIEIGALVEGDQLPAIRTLAEELVGTGVTVTTLCPGFTKTEFHERAGFQRSSRWLAMMSAKDVAQIGYHGLMNGKRIVIPGWRNKLTAAVSRRLSATFTAKIVRRMNDR